MIRGVTVALILSCVFSTAHANEGETAYASCVACHGQAGEGSAALSAPQLSGQHKSYLIEQLIGFREGKRGTHPEDTHGNIMRSSAQNLSNDTIEALSTYLAALSPQEHTSMVKGDAQRGALLYRQNCSDCHGDNAQGVSTIHAPNLVVLQDWYIRQQINSYLTGWRGHEAASTRAKSMRSMAVQLSNKQELEDVIAWLESL